MSASKKIGDGQTKVAPRLLIPRLGGGGWRVEDNFGVCDL